MRARRGFSNEGVGGFLESILAVMAVITASSLFLVMLSVGAVQETGREVDLKALVDELQEQGLWPSSDERVEMENMNGRFARLVLPSGVAGIQLSYRKMGNDTVLLTFGMVPPEGATVYGERAPMLIKNEGRAVPVMVEVLAW